MQRSVRNGARPQHQTWLFRNADLVELPFEARLLFIGLWTIADRSGRMEDRPKQIKMELFPADSVDVDALLDELAAIGVVARYSHDGKRYLYRW